MDCWVDLHAQVQEQYTRRVTDEGVEALVHPYQRDEMASWLPDAAIDAAAEALTEQLDLMTEDHADLSDLSDLSGLSGLSGLSEFSGLSEASLLVEGRREDEDAHGPESVAG
jgi:hypothetical protein